MNEELLASVQEAAAAEAAERKSVTYTVGDFRIVTNGSGELISITRR